MRIRVLAASAAMLLLTAGCGDPRKPEPAAAAPKPQATEFPAEVAGGACELLNFGVVDDFLGVRFDVAAAGEQRETFTCVLQTEGQSWPDLSLAVSETSADASVFATDVRPDGAKAVKGIGEAGYQQDSSATDGHGPAVEIGWLSATGRLLILRYTFAKGESKADATAMAPILVDLAKDLDVALKAAT